MTPDKVIKRVGDLKGERGLWESHWQDLADYIIPRKNEIVTKNVAKGRKKGEFLFDNTAMVSCELLSGALHGLLTNPSQIWFELSTGNPEMDNNEEVMLFLQRLGKRMHEVLNNTNFQTEIHEVYLDLVCFGTAAMSIEEDKEKVVLFNSKNLADIFIAENNKGVIDEVYRCFEWDARKIISEFAKGVDEMDEMALTDAVGKSVARAYKVGDNRKFKVIHGVYKEHLTKKKALAYISQYILEEDKFELRSGGFRQMPYVVPRWTKVTGETYGRSPGMNALPEAKTLNAMTKAVLKGAQKTVDPPMQAPDDGLVRPTIARPGSISYYRAGSKDRIEPIFTNVRIDLGVELTRDRQNRVREAFFVDQLQLIQGPQMTATEVNRRTEERMRLLGPMLGRQHSELLRPMIDRLLDIMVRRNMIEDMPEILADSDLQVQYSSTIARSQKIDQGQNLLRAFEASAPFIEAVPTALDMIDPDKVIKENWKIYGAPVEVLRSAQAIGELRKARQQAQQAAMKRQQDLDNTDQAAKLAPIAAQEGQQQQEE